VGDCDNVYVFSLQILGDSQRSLASGSSNYDMRKPFVNEIRNNLHTSAGIFFPGFFKIFDLSNHCIPPVMAVKRAVELM
jgi:hypothetical protein